jgi:hypothetical protein
MSSRNNQNLVESKSIAQKEFEANSLKEITINGIKLIHADRYNFTVEQNNSKGYFGTLRYALRRFYILLHGELTIKFENFADEYADVKASMPCSLIDIENIKIELLEGVSK